MISWPNPLVRDLARRNAILFLGAGVSRNSLGNNGQRPPTWSQFLDVALEKCSNPKKHVKALLRENDLLTTCEILKEKLDEEWIKTIDESFRIPQFKVADIHRHLLRLDLPLVLTPNFDKIYDNFAQNEWYGNIRIKSYTDGDLSDVVRRGDRTILKIHGSIDYPDQMIFTRSEYAQARAKYPEFYGLLDALALTRTFIFIGCGFSDPDVQLFLERSISAYPTSSPHYITVPTPFHSDIIKSVRSNYNLKTLLYDPKNGHEELTKSLELLIGMVEEEREAIAQSQTW